MLFLLHADTTFYGRINVGYEWQKTIVGKDSTLYAIFEDPEIEEGVFGEGLWGKDVPVSRSFIMGQLGIGAEYSFNKNIFVGAEIGFGLHGKDEEAMTEYDFKQMQAHSLYGKVFAGYKVHPNVSIYMPVGIEIQKHYYHDKQFCNKFNSRNVEEFVDANMVSAVVGLGVALPFNDNWSVKLEYNAVIGFKKTLNGVQPSEADDLDLKVTRDLSITKHRVMLGLQYNFNKL